MDGFEWFNGYQTELLTWGGGASSKVKDQYIGTHPKQNIAKN